MCKQYIESLSYKSVEGHYTSEALEWAEVNGQSYAKIWLFSVVPSQQRHKLDDKAKGCIFAGYNSKSKDYQLYNL